MTLAHRAFAFDYAAFHDELRPLLLSALQTTDTSGLFEWIEGNLRELVDPDAGEPLPKNWQALLEDGDVHELADFALTKYYDVDLDIGLDVDWKKLAELLEKSGQVSTLLLGAPLGPKGAELDPGHQGSFFQTALEVNSALEAIQSVLQAQPTLATELAPVQGMFQQAARHHRGLYVTF